MAAAGPASRGPPSTCRSRGTASSFPRTRRAATANSDPPSASREEGPWPRTKRAASRSRPREPRPGERDPDVGPHTSQSSLRAIAWRRSRRGSRREESGKPRSATRHPPPSPTVSEEFLLTVEVAEPTVRERHVLRLLALKIGGGLSEPASEQGGCEARASAGRGRCYLTSSRRSPRDRLCRGDSPEPLSSSVAYVVRRLGIAPYRSDGTHVAPAIVPSNALPESSAVLVPVPSSKSQRVTVSASLTRFVGTLMVGPE